MSTRAAAFGIVRCVVLQELTTRKDILFSTVDLAMWSFLEQNVTIIAACIPVLYTVFRAVLGVGSSRSNNKASTGRGGNSYAIHGQRRKYAEAYGPSSRRRSRYLDIDYKMQWTTTVTGGVWAVDTSKTGSDDGEGGDRGTSSEDGILGLETTHRGIIRTTEVVVSEQTSPV